MEQFNTNDINDVRHVTNKDVRGNDMRHVIDKDVGDVRGNDVTVADKDMRDVRGKDVTVIDKDVTAKDIDVRNKIQKKR